MKLIDRIFKNKAKLKTKANVDLNSKDFKKIVIKSLSEFLRPLGYKRKDNNFRKENNHLSYFIQVQSSKYSTVKCAEITVNLGIVCKMLLEDDILNKYNIMDSHWRQRIGFYMANPRDYWWQIDSVKSAEKASQEIAKLINERVFNEWDNIVEISDLIRIWRNDKCPGITDMQRMNFLKILENKNK